LNEVKIAPSLAAAPFGELARTVRELESCGADILHIDIEDGSFVPMMTLGIRIIQEIRPLTRLPFDVHLMVNHPEWLIPVLADMGVDMISVHYEACPYPRRTLGIIAERKIQAGLAFNPATPIPCLSHCLPYLDFILVLSTEPEAASCKFLPSVLTKVIDGRKQAELANIRWMVDGGIGIENIAEVLEAGVDAIVSGRDIFKNGAISENLGALKNVIEQYQRTKHASSKRS
jgi:ribulose-phosphate 3-epimerase